MKKIRHNKSGFALFSVLAIIAALSIMLGMLLKLGEQRAFTARRLINQVKALAYAEAGIDYAYAILSVDFDQKDNPDAFLMDSSVPQTVVLNSSNDGVFSLVMGQLSEDEPESISEAIKNDYANGSFSLTITPISNKYVIINSVGKCGDAARTAEVLIDDENAGSEGSTPATDYSSMEGFNYAVLSGGTFNFRGAGTVTGSKMHSNSAIDVSGSAGSNLDISSSVEISIGNVTIDGSLTAPVVDSHKNSNIIGGTSEQPVPPVKIPDIDLTPYLAWAQQNGEVHNGFTISSSYTPVGGVLWVNGDVTISSHAVINGSIIATGSIHVSGAVEINPTTTVFAMASRDGDITNTSSGRLNGLIYAKTGNYSQTANGELYGQLIINGTIKKGGNSDIINFVRSVPTPPGGPGSTNPTTAWPVVSAWQK